MQIKALKISDLALIPGLQPDGWPDLRPEFQFYLDQPYCYPIKVCEQENIIGLGASINYGQTAWLAHIIVEKNNRGQGIGSMIVRYLLDTLQAKGVSTCSLIATELGQSIYAKAGFRVTGEYCYLIRDKISYTTSNSASEVVPYDTIYQQELLNLDQSISGEKRKLILSPHLSKAILYLEKGHNLQGYYLPSLKEGPIFALNEQVGLALMRLKYPNAQKAVLPFSNQAGLNFLKNIGYKPSKEKGVRMIYGADFSVALDKIYSRIGGNFG